MTIAVESREGETRVGGARLENMLVVTKNGAEIMDYSRATRSSWRRGRHPPRKRNQTVTPSLADGYEPELDAVCTVR